MSDFYKTRMGQQFYEKTLPTLVDQIATLSRAVEKLTRQLERATAEDSG